MTARWLLLALLALPATLAADLAAPRRESLAWRRRCAEALQRALDLPRRESIEEMMTPDGVSIGENVMCLIAPCVDDVAVVTDDDARSEPWKCDPPFRLWVSSTRCSATCERRVPHRHASFTVLGADARACRSKAATVRAAIDRACLK